MPSQRSIRPLGRCPSRRLRRSPQPRRPSPARRDRARASGQPLRSGDIALGEWPRVQAGAPSTGCGGSCPETPLPRHPLGPCFGGLGARMRECPGAREGCALSLGLVAPALPPGPGGAFGVGARSVGMALLRRPLRRGSCENAMRHAGMGQVPPLVSEGGAAASEAIRARLKSARARTSPSAHAPPCSFVPVVGGAEYTTCAPSGHHICHACVHRRILKVLQVELYPKSSVRGWSWVASIWAEQSSLSDISSFCDFLKKHLPEGHFGLLPMRADSPIWAN